MKGTMYREHKIIAVMVFIWLIIASMPVQAKLLLPEQYPEGTCELAAKEFQKAYGGSLVFLLPQKDGKWIEGEYAGMWINRAYVKGNQQYYYFNYPDGRIFSSLKEVTDEYSYYQGDTKITYYAFVYGEDSIPVGITWHY